MPVGCYKQMSTIKEGVIMRLQCTCTRHILYALSSVEGYRSSIAIHQFSTINGPVQHHR